MLVDAVVYLGAAVLCVPIAKRLRLGSVLGYLIAGCLIGPFGLRFVQDPASTLHFAEIGVVLMLFLIGLELDPKHLWTMRRAVFVGGAAQMAACAAAIFAGLLACGLPWQAALVAGLALALSSTAVCMQTMAERNLLPTALGRTSFAVLLFQDITAIPLVALVPLLADAPAEGGSSGSAVGLLRGVGAVVAVFVIGRFVTNPVLRVIARTGLREVFTAFTLLLVLGVAELMSRAGVSMALGAFLAGVLLAGSEYRHALETDLEPFKGLLMGLFFIAVGMSIDFALLADRPLAVLGLVLGFQLLKAAALRLVAGPIGVGSRQRWLFAAMLAQGGEFAFVVFGVARTASLLPGQWDSLLTLAVALSMALTPILLIVHDRALARAAAATPREPDTIEDQGGGVLIAGFGRVGQIVGRLLLASGKTATILDHDPDQIEMLKRFGFRVFYGDVTRVDLLEAAGAARAKVIVVAVDEIETSLEVIDLAREHFPKARLVARARNVPHYFELRTRGVDIVERETFESALQLGRRTLEALGVRAHEARERADAFRRHNKKMLEDLLPHMQDEAQRVALARSARDELERQFERDRAELEREHGHGWHAERERSDAS
ncbi:MAG: glutathione-regulated potassium-efflux system protein KefC [Polyangiaceae bacterium]|nr:glutathione-regulated potassium-efflux system protein KefC [Polyangiaceae bacterium]